MEGGVVVLLLVAAVCVVLMLAVSSRLNVVVGRGRVGQKGAFFRVFCLLCLVGSVRAGPPFCAFFVFF